MAKTISQQESESRVLVEIATPGPFGEAVANVWSAIGVARDICWAHRISDEPDRVIRVADMILSHMRDDDERA